VIIGNNRLFNKCPGRWLSGSTASDSRSNWNTSGSSKNVWLQEGLEFLEGISPYSGHPDGYNMEYSQIDPLRSGGMVSQQFVAGSGSLAGSLFGGYNLESNLTASGDVTNAACGLIIFAVAAITGSVTLSASVAASLAAAASLAGSGNLSAALGALASAVAALTGSGSPAASITAKAGIGAGITVTGDLLSTANVGDAVWKFLIENGYTASDLMRILTAIAVGKTTIVGSTVTFRDTADTKNRVVATMDGSERDTVTLDVT